MSPLSKCIGIAPDSTPGSATLLPATSINGLHIDFPKPPCAQRTVYPFPPTRPRTISATFMKLFESVLRGKDAPLFHHGGEEVVVALALLGQPLRRNRQQCKCGRRPHIPHGRTKSPRRFQLEFCPLRDDAQVHVAVRPSFPARVRAKKVHRPQRHNPIHRFQAAGKGFTLALQARRQILQAQLHAVQSIAAPARRQAGSAVILANRSWRVRSSSLPGSGH